MCFFNATFSSPRELMTTAGWKQWLVSTWTVSRLIRFKMDKVSNFLPRFILVVYLTHQGCIPTDVYFHGSFSFKTKIGTTNLFLVHRRQRKKSNGIRRFSKWPPLWPKRPSPGRGRQENILSWPSNCCLWTMFNTQCLLWRGGLWIQRPSPASPAFNM